MFPVLIGLSAATLFGLLAHGIYGTSGVIQHEWIDIVFWSLIGAGAGVSLINTIGACLPCRFSKVVRAARLESRLCGATPCHH